MSTANDDFPRGQVLTNTIGGFGASVTFPASPGIVWTLTEAIAQASYVGSAGGTLAALQVTTGGVNYFLSHAGLPSTWTVADIEWSGEIQSPMGGALTVTCINTDGGASPNRSLVTAQAYPG